MVGWVSLFLCMMVVMVVIPLSGDASPFKSFSQEFECTAFVVDLSINATKRKVARHFSCSYPVREI